MLLFSLLCVSMYNILHIVEDGKHSKSTTVSNTTPEGLDYTYFSSILSSSTTDSTKAKEQLQHNIPELQWAVEQCSQLDAFTTAYKHVQAAVTMINAINTTISQPNLVRKRSYAPNSNHEPTLKFFSTKKRRTTKSTLNKPTQEEVNDCKEKLESEEQVFCAICL